jgi:hypothetical protein
MVRTSSVCVECVVCRRNGGEDSADYWCLRRTVVPPENPRNDMIRQCLDV